MLERESIDPLDDPIQQLQLVAAEILRMRDILGDMLKALPSWTYEDLSGREDVSGVLRAYERALDRSGRVLIEMVKLDLDERLAKLSAAQGRIAIQLFEAVLLAKEVGLSKEQIRTAKTIIAREVPRVSALPADELALG